MFGADDEEGDFLSPTGGAKLASLFGLDHEANQGNESFQYTAPKQPRKSSNPVTQKPAPPGVPSVLFATAVQAFRYINGQYIKQGKLGAAVLGNHMIKEYKLLLYLSQQKQVTTAKIHLGFVFTVQTNNYCTFYDDQRQNWSLMFESEKALSNFCKQVCLAKANSTAFLETVVIQDLCLGEGKEVENGDSLEVVYTGWFLQNHTIGQMFDSNHSKEKLLRLKVGTGKVIKGWEEGMLGMKKACVRLIIIPPNLAYGSKGVSDCIPANSTLIFETEIRRVKFFKDSDSDRASSSSRDSATPSFTPSLAPSVENLAPEPAVQMTASGPGRPGDSPLHAKSNSQGEQLINPDATKAKLICRIAKMGQPMLPFMSGVVSQPDSSDSELEDTSGSRMKDQAASPFTVPISTDATALAQVHPHTALPSALVRVTPQPPGSNHAFQPYSYTQTSAAPSLLQPVGQVYPAQAVSYMGSSDMTSFIMSEARQHNTEIRLAIGKVADKLDQLTSKVDDLQRNGTLFLGVSSMSMETSMIVHNIQRIVQENECLKKDVFDKSSRIEEQNHKIGELINQNQRYMEQSNLLLEQRNDSQKISSEQSQARLLQAEKDKHALPEDPGSDQVTLTEDLSLSVARLSKLQLEASAHQQKSIELQTKLTSVLQDSENQCQNITFLEQQLEELKEAAERTQAQYYSEKQRRKEMELRVKNMEEELQDLKTDQEALERTVLETKRKWHAERKRWEDEVEELRKSCQQELDILRTQLCKARTSTNSSASKQLSQMQAELEEEWKEKWEQILASTNEQHNRELAELTEQRDALQDELIQLQEKVLLLKQLKESGEQSALPHSGQAEELQTLQEKYPALEQQGLTVKEKLEKRVADLEKKLAQQDNSGDTAEEVKRVMNGVFHSLRGEFDLSESYTGQDVLGVIVTTIKNVTLQLLSGTNKSSMCKKKVEREEHDEESSALRQTKKKLDQNLNENEEREVKEDPKEEGKPLVAVTFKQVSETQVNQKVVSEKENRTVADSEIQSQSESLNASDLHSASSAETQETSAHCKVQQDQGKHDIPGTPTEQKDFNKSPNPIDDPGENLSLEKGQETVSEQKASTNIKVAKESMENGKLVQEMNSDSQKAFGPPANPPPPPNALQSNPGKETSSTEEIGEENREESYFQAPTPSKPPPDPTEEEEEDEMSLKGRPPPAPLFGDDEDDDDDDDLDWLN